MDPQYSRPRRGKILIWPIILAILFMAYQWFSADTVTNPETGQTSRVALNSKQEETLGLQSFRQVLSEQKAITSGPQYEMVQRVMQRLIPATGEAAEKFKWQVAVVDSDQINAFCLPGGKMVVYTGIIPVAQNEAALAAVLGHEMAHATSHHGAQRLLHSQLANTAMMAGAVSTSQMDPDQQRMVMGAIGAGATYGVINPYSRGHETEADAIGLMYMARAGYDPREAITFWQRMAQAGGQKPPEFLSTHPADSTRIQNLKALMPKAIEEYEKAVAAGKGQR